MTVEKSSEFQALIDEVNAILYTSEEERKPLIENLRTTYMNFAESLMRKDPEWYKKKEFSKERAVDQIAVSFLTEVVDEEEFAERSAQNNLGIPVAVLIKMARLYALEPGHISSDQDRAVSDMRRARRELKELIANKRTAMEVLLPTLPKDVQKALAILLYPDKD